MLSIRINYHCRRFPDNFFIFFPSKEFVYDSNESSIYGDWNDVTCTIRVATHVEEEGEHELTEEQIRNSFYHEMFHAFIFFSGLKQDEMIVQAFANFLREYETSKK